MFALCNLKPTSKTRWNFLAGFLYQQERDFESLLRERKGTKAFLVKASHVEMLESTKTRDVNERLCHKY